MTFEKLKVLQGLPGARLYQNPFETTNNPFETAEMLPQLVVGTEMPDGETLYLGIPSFTEEAAWTAAHQMLDAAIYEFQKRAETCSPQDWRNN